MLVVAAAIGQLAGAWWPLSHINEEGSRDA
jgi:DNA-binding transcriptional regulator of glucitol operon